MHAVDFPSTKLGGSVVRIALLLYKHMIKYSGPPTCTYIGNIIVHAYIHVQYVVAVQ